jgi:hypothetical protein
MADLSYLPPIEEPEVQFDPTPYEPPSELPMPLKTGNYLLKLIAGTYNATEEVDGDEPQVVASGLPFLFGYTRAGFLKATFTVEVVGQLARTPGSKVETVTEVGKGRKIAFQRINRTPFKKGNRIGKNMMKDLLYAFGYDVAELEETNQAYADAFEASLGKTAKGRVIRRVGVDTGKPDPTNPTRNVYKEFRDTDFDEQGEVSIYMDDFSKVQGEPQEGRAIDIIRARNEVDAWFEFVDEEA